MSSQILDLDGEFIYTKETYNGKRFFQKMIAEEYIIEIEIYDFVKSHNHPNICNCYLIDHENKTITMEFLKTYLPIPYKAIDIMRSLKSFLQSNGIVYLDWKPDNIGIDEKGVIKLFDFNSSSFFQNQEFIPNDSFIFEDFITKTPYTTPIECDNWKFEENFVKSMIKDQK